jgi:hypothetical protein
MKNCFKDFTPIGTFIKSKIVSYPTDSGVFIWQNIFLIKLETNTPVTIFFVKRIAENRWCE